MPNPGTPILTPARSLDPPPNRGPSIWDLFTHPAARLVATVVCGAAWIVKEAAPQGHIAQQVAARVFDLCVVAGVGSLGVSSAKR